MNCKKCGNLLDQNAKFCPICGETIVAENAGVSPVNSMPNGETIKPTGVEMPAPQAQAPVEPSNVAASPEPPLAPGVQATPNVTPEVTPNVTPGMNTPQDPMPNGVGTPASPAEPVMPNPQVPRASAVNVQNQVPVTPTPETPVAPIPPKKKNNKRFLIIVIILVIIIGFLALAAATGNLKFSFKVNTGKPSAGTTTTTTTTTTQPIASTTTTTTTQATNNTISYQGMAFPIPSGFSAEVTDLGLMYTNATQRAAFLSALFNATITEVISSAEALKTELTTQGFSNITYTNSSYNGVSYLLYNVTYNNQNLGIVFTDINNQYVLRSTLYYIDTVGANRYIDYTTNVSKNVNTGSSNFSTSLPEISGSKVELPEVKFN